jgi:hypothetical protein
MVKKNGHKYGLQAEADMIRFDRKGKPQVDDPKVKERIMGMRYNVYLSAVMAAEMLNDSKLGIEASIKRTLTNEELYLPHVMGEGGARKLLKLAQGPKKNSPAARSFPEAAKANKGLFYKKEGKRTVAVSHADLHERMTDKISRLRDHFGDAIATIDSGFKATNVQMPEQAFADNVMPDQQEQGIPSYLFER